MKIPFTIYDLRFTRGGGRSPVNAVSRHSSLVTRHSRGIALVITLVLLSVITFMTIAFLVLSRRDRGSVTTVTDANTAKFAADSAFERAKAEMIAPILAMTNDQQFDLLVSTNYINRNGFDPNAVDGRTNVNYDYTVAGTPLSQAQFQQNLTNLYYNPRPPVYVSTNARSPFNDFRFYLDLNRNSHFDTNGLLPVLTGIPGLPWLDTNGNPIATFNPPNILSNNFVGDPEWIGVLEFPDRPHGPNNRFVARYAYIVLPVGKMLDVNYMHNQAVTRALSTANDGYLRNQGVGTWELNLAAFLTDLNTNVWQPQVNPYRYLRAGGLNTTNNQGLAFEDSLALLAYRYNYNYQTLSSASALFPSGASPFVNDGIDEYSDGPTMLGNSLSEGLSVDQVGEKWAGSDNTNHFFTTQDFFDRSKIFPAIGGFVDRLQNVGTSNDTYNAYTYYRMLAQLGTDSEVDNRINVNYRNVSNSVVVPGMETNLYAWRPLEFFTNAANAMLADLKLKDPNNNPITVTNIPLFPVNYYTPALHRILQLAANIYDSTTNRFIGGGPTNYPSVFRPYFRTENISGTNWVFISGYVEETSTLNPTDGINLSYVDVGYFASNNTFNPNLNVNLNGVPWVVGAKKGFPNFNAFAMKNALNVSRKLEFTNYNAASQSGVTNQMFLFGLTNTFGVEAWNSYTNVYGRSLRLVVTNEISIIVRTNVAGLGVPFLSITNLPFGAATNINSWTNWSLRNPGSGNSFQIPLYQTFNLTNGIYHYDPAFGWRVYAIVPPIWGGITTPQLWMNLSVKLRYWLVDTSVDRVVDYVNIVGEQAPVDLMSALGSNPGSYPGNMWATNSFGGLPAGIYHQIQISKGAESAPGFTDTEGQQCFRRHLGLPNTAGAECSLTNYFQAPFTPSRTVYQTISWTVNDPLVHYMAGDLADLFTSSQNTIQVDSISQDPTALFSNPSKRLPDHFRPWGGNVAGGSDTTPSTMKDITVKDPLVYKSDDWDFPTNRLPNIGWLGRVHRGSPWQTVYMKPYTKSGVFTNSATWKNWSGNTNVWVLANGVVNDFWYSMPTNDYHLFDLFTAVPNDNAGRGRLNINQTNLAAWSAVLSGVAVITNQPGTNILGWRTIDPAGVPAMENPPPLIQIWTNINAVRGNLYVTNGPVFAGQQFHSVGDILASPALTLQSPFLTNAMPWLLGNSSQTQSGISDEVLERIPQQIMSLLSLSHEPRFMVYSFGQTLHPAEHSLVTGGPFNGLCTNYQITAETATRALVRAEPFAVTNGNIISTNYNLVVEQYNVLPPD